MASLRPRMGAALVALAAALCVPSSAAAAEQLLTLYSPPIKTQPYVHDTHYLTLKPDGVQAPKEGGYITGFKEQVLVDSKRPDAKPLDNARMMIHHFLYFAPGRQDDSPGGCWRGSGFLAGRGEEHPEGDFSSFTPPERRAEYGLNNRLADGSAPTWRLMAMVMNHVKQPKTVYVRTRVWYTTDEPRKPVMPMVVGNCAQLGNGMAYDVPGGGGKGAEFVDQSTWTVPDGFDGRILLAASHQHGGGKYHTLSSDTCNRQLFRSETYHGPRDHIYNTIRPILHEPGPIANGTFGTSQGVPITSGEVLRRRAVHDNANLHVAAMGFWVLHTVRDETVRPCDPMPTDVTEVNRPARWDRNPNFGLRVPQLAPPERSPLRRFNGSPLLVADWGFDVGRVQARVGRPLTWRFDGRLPHSVTVTTGPRGFSSRYSGQTSGTYTFTPKVKGTYRLTCLVHPTTMGQTVVVK
jgi:hypothetical protein